MQLSRWVRRMLMMGRTPREHAGRIKGSASAYCRLIGLRGQVASDVAESSISRSSNSG